MTLVIAMHNIPEGMCIAVPIFAATGSHWEAFKMSILSGLTEPLGALLALYFLRPFINEITIVYTLMFVSGVMISVSINELLPGKLQYTSCYCICYKFNKSYFYIS